LELAAGTGVLTRELLRLAGAPVVATDLNTPMVAFGGSRVAGAQWREADASHLPFDDASFELVACQFGVMFFPDKPGAFAEARRVLSPDGAFLFSTWDRVETHVFAAALLAAVAAVFPTDPPTFVTEIPHGYHDVDAIRRDLRIAEFGAVTIEEVTCTGEATSVADVARGFCLGTPLRAALESRGDLAGAVASIEREMTQRLGSGPVTGTMRAYVVTAQP
jgi:ubiquinone/menaquinone biosynthesis C-methylase UbiE